MTLAESVIEEAAIGWFEQLGYAVLPGTPNAPGDFTAGVEALLEGELERRGILPLHAAPLRSLSAQTPVAPD